MQWNDAVSKASRKGMKFRTPYYDEPTGRQEMLVSYLRTAVGVVGYSPHVITEAEYHLGASYVFRNYSQREFWLSRHSKLLYRAFESTAVDSGEYISR